MSFDIELEISKAFMEIAYEPGELSFLAATSKIELPIRDRLSWQLQKYLSGLDVVREWNRTDIAILREEEPLALIELKAMYAFDAMNGHLGKFFKAVKSDEEKACVLAGKTATVYTVLLSSNPLIDDTIQLPSFIKYRDGIRRALRNNDAATISAVTDSKVRNMFLGAGERVLVCYNSIEDSGGYFGIAYEVQSWVFRHET